MRSYNKNNVPLKFQKQDIDNLPPFWRQEFERELAENNFLLGGKSLLLLGDGAEDAMCLWAQCLTIAGFDCYVANPLELAYRIGNCPVLWDNEERKDDFTNAETYLIRRAFDTQLAPEEHRQLLSFMQIAVDDSCVLVIASDEAEPNIANYGTGVADFIEQNFEAIQNGKTTKKRRITKTADK